MSISKKIKELEKQFSSDLSVVVDNKDQKAELYNKYLGRKGLVNKLYHLLSAVDDQKKPLYGNQINELKNTIKLVALEGEVRMLRKELNDRKTND